MSSTLSDVRANIDWITDRVATGGDLDPRVSIAIQQIESLVAQGVTHVIDNRIEKSDERLFAAIAPEIKYLHNPIDDRHGLQVPNSWFKKMLAFARDAFDSGGTVFAHCHMGVNRGPSSAMAVLMDWYGYDARTAYDMVREAREIAFVGYADSVAKYFARQAKLAPEMYSRTMADFFGHLKTIRTPAESERINHAIMSLHERDWDIQNGVIRAKAGE